MMFIARQMQEKSYEQGLFQVYVDLTKAFGIVNKELLLRRLVCRSHFANVLPFFHDGMEVTFNDVRLLSESFKMTKGGKQG